MPKGYAGGFMEIAGTSAQRLAMYAEILSVIDVRRQATGAPMLGASVEKFIIDAQFSELENDILENPGAFETWLVRPRDPRQG
jgi:hypothetical protein